MPRDGVTEEKVSDQLEGWLRADGKRSLGSLIDLFGERSFAIVFVILMAVPALPLPTGGVTHVFEVITGLLALELIVGRRTIWLPDRFKRRDLAGDRSDRFTTSLIKRIRWFERFSKPRGRRLLDHRLSGMVFGLIVLALTATAFVAPPFSGLDTLPALGVVVLSLGVLLLDVVLTAVGIAIGALGAALTLFLGSLVTKLVGDLF